MGGPMANKKPQAKASGPGLTKPVRLIVRRGAQRRYDALQAKTKDLPVEVSWDRRKDDPEEGLARPPAVERRQEPPFTWEVADFVVAPDSPWESAARDRRRAGESPTPSRKSTRSSRKSS